MDWKEDDERGAEICVYVWQSEQFMANKSPVGLCEVNLSIVPHPEQGEA